jgi:hypothetical protein
MCVDDLMVPEYHDQLDQYGIEIIDGIAAGSGSTHEAILLLHRGSSRQEFRVQSVHSAAGSISGALRAQNEGPLPVMVLAPFISERTATSLRSAGIAYLDSAGNASISFGDVLVDVRGRRGARIDDHLTAPKETNLFSARRAQIIFALIVWPELLQAPLRETSSAANSSIGQAHSTLNLLIEAGYLDEHPRRWRRRAELVEHWAASYRTGLMPTLRLATFVSENRHLALAADDDVEVSGEAALPSRLRSTTLTGYVERLDPRLPASHRWRSATTDANVFLRKRFWTAPAISDTPDVYVSPGSAPWLIVYADLLASDDARQREVAAEWRTQDVRFL